MLCVLDWKPQVIYFLGLQSIDIVIQNYKKETVYIFCVLKIEKEV